MAGGQFRYLLPRAGLSAPRVNIPDGPLTGEWFRQFITIHLNPYALQGTQGQAGGNATPPPTFTTQVNSPISGGTMVLANIADTTQASWVRGQDVHLPDAVAWDVNANGGVVDVLFNIANTWGNGYVMRFDARNGQVAGQILKMTSGTMASIGAAVAAVNTQALGGTYRVVAVIGLNGAMKLYVDGELQWKATDTTYSPNGSTYLAAEVVAGTKVWAPTAIDGTLDMTADGVQFVHLASDHASNNVAYNFRGVYSAGNAYVKGDEVVYGQTYWLALANSTGSTPSTSNANWQAVASYNAYQGAWSAATSYVKGDEVTYGGNYWVAIAANTNSAPTTSNANWQIAGPTNLDNVADGPTYGRMKNTSLTGNDFDFSKGGVNKSVDYLDTRNYRPQNLVKYVYGPPAIATGDGLGAYMLFAGGVNFPAIIEYDVICSTNGLLDLGPIISNGSVGPNGYLFRFDSRPGQSHCIFRTDNGTWSAALGAGPANSAQLTGVHHVRWYFNGTTGFMCMWVDGILQFAVTDNTYTTTNSNIYGGYEVNTIMVAPSYLARMPAPPSVSAAANTQLTQSSTTTTINVSAGTFYLGNVTLNFNSGSVNPGSYGKFYVYFDDPTYAGGAETFYTSTSALDTSKGSGRCYVGTITTASGGGGGGGSLGGGGCCLHESQMIELADGREIPARELTPDMILLSHEGPTPITELRFLPHREWFKVRLDNGVELFVAGDHRFLDDDFNQLRTWDLKLGQRVRARNGYAIVTGLDVLWEHGTKVAIEVGEPHTYYVQGILSHNKQLC